ncbi:MAG: class I SAM-dependent methyltransferase [Armatimonadetes bacterium]|nr:class I SAM-dependent methyltransferase [Armatimonadota bacterium]
MLEPIDAKPFFTCIRKAAAKAVPLLADGEAKNATLARVLTPVDYMRCAEFPLAAGQMLLEPGMKVLDVSSPQWFSLCMAMKNPDVEFYYINILESELDQIRDASAVLGVDNINYQQKDVRSLDFESRSFDRVVSISVLEHIAPEVGGDVQALESIKRVMTDSGALTVSVPLKQTRNVVYQDGPVYERSGCQRNFYAREYDYSQFSEAQSAAGFTIREKVFICEKPGLGAIDYWQWGPGKTSQYSRFLLLLLKCTRKIVRISLEGQLAHRYLRQSDKAIARTVNIVATSIKK